MFTGLLKNEFIKLFAKKKTYIILCLYIALAVILVILGESTESSYLKSKDPVYMIENLQNQINYEKEYLDSLNNQPNMSDEDRERQIEYSNQYIADLEEEIGRLEANINAEYDWRQEVQNQLEDKKAELATYDEKDLGMHEYTTYLKQEIGKLEMQLKTNTSPEDEFLNSGVNYLYMNLSVVATAFLSFGLVLFNSETVSGEYNPGTLKFLLIQPVTRTKVLLSKFIVMVLSSTSLIVGVQVLFFLGVGIIKGFGNFSRPMLVGIKYEKVLEGGHEIIQRIAGSGTYIPLWEYVLKMLLIEVLVIIVTIAFIFMVSTISKSSIVSITLCISLLLGLNILHGLSNSYNKISHLIFFHFGDLDGIVSGNIIGKTQSLSFTYPNVIIVSIITTIVCVSVAVGVFKKRDLLI